MKIRRHSKRIAAKLASRPVRKGWTDYELAWMDSTLNVYEQTREWLIAAVRDLDAQKVRGRGRMLWDGQKTHGGLA